MSPGIPPSLDRQDRHITVAVTSAVLLAIFAATIYVLSRRSDGPPEGGGPVSGQDRLEAYLAEEERASAYKALRDHLDQMRNEPDTAAVFCRDSVHRWVNGEIEFRGDVDFEMRSGVMQRREYVARLSGSKADGWEVLSVDLGPPYPAP